MQFFLYEVVARVVAAYLCFDCYRDLRTGLIDRKIGIYNPDLIEWLLDWSNWAVHRDTQPIQYWIQIVVHVGVMLSCLAVAVFGWFHPDS
jgi:hypothetical protein